MLSLSPSCRFRPLPMLWTAALFASLFVLPPPVSALEATPSSWIVFASATCEECEWLKTDFFPDLETRVGTPLPTIHFVDLDDETNYEALVMVEETLGVSGSEVPAVLLGDTMLYGKAAVAEWGRSVGTRLPRTTLPADVMPFLRRADSETYRQLLGLSPRQPDGYRDDAVPPRAVKPEPADEALVEVEDYREAELMFFETAGCKDCARAVKQLAYAAGKIPGIRVFRLVTRTPEQQALQFAVTSHLKVPLNERLATPTFVTGTQALVGDRITDVKLLDMLRERPQEAPFWAAWDEEAALADASRQIQFTARKMTIPAVIVAGLIDGINPCAFAVIVFLVSYLTLTGKMGRNFVLIYGFIFAAGVYVCYLLIGLGLFQLLDFMQRWQGVTRTVFAGIGVICLLFAVGAAIDTIRAFRGGAGKMKFGMPKRFHKVVHRLIREDVSRGALGLGAFLVGIAVSTIELVCTGQIYLPIIMFINSTARGARSLFLLVVYNMAFIIPLLVVVLLAAKGLGSDTFAKWGRKHAAMTRALTFLLVLALAGVMFYMAART